MARGLNEFIEKLKLLEVELLKAGPKIAVEIAQSATALSIRRIQKEGVTGKKYSTHPMFATQNMFNRKDRFKPTEIASELGRDESGKLVKGGSRNKKGEVAKKSTAKKRVMWIKFKGARKAVPVMLLPGGYKELRQLNGLQSNFVDLTFSGRMVQNIKVLKSSSREAKFLAIVGVDNPENKGKLAGNAKKYGDFLAPTEKEEEVLSTIPLNRITEIIKKVLA